MGPSGHSDPVCDDTEEVVLEGLGVVLERDAGCMRWLSWTCRFERLSGAELSERLRATGLLDSSHLAGLVQLELEGRHRLIIVPATDRVQLRLDICVPRDERPQRALALAVELAARAAAAPPRAS